MGDLLNLTCRFDKPFDKPKKPRVKKPEQFLDQSTVIEENKVTLVLPLKVTNEGNCNENWRTKHARHKKQQTMIQLLCRHPVQFVKLPCKIHMVRYAPRMLDVADNLPYSFKWLNDAVCDLLIPGLKAGRADGDPRISLSCGQEKSKHYGLKIVFEF